MECRVLFNYTTTEADKLTIKKGEIIKNVVTKGKGLFEGTLKGKTGLFPGDCVILLNKSVEIPEIRSKPAEVILQNNRSSVRRLRVIFSYVPEKGDELTLDVGDVVEFIEETEEGWWRGKLKGKTGIFPSNFVEDLEEGKTNGNFDIGKPKEIMHQDVPTLHPKPPKVRELARCFYPYTAQSEDELSLSVGDIITVLWRQCEDEGWWCGELQGKIGIFPDNFVTSITPGEVQPTGKLNGTQLKLSEQKRNVVYVTDWMNKNAAVDIPSEKSSVSAASAPGNTILEGNEKAAIFTSKKLDLAATPPPGNTIQEGNEKAVIFAPKKLDLAASSAPENTIREANADVACTSNELARLQQAQSDKIRKNLTSLIVMTELNPIMIAIFEEMDILGDGDIATLNTERNEQEKIRRFYKIIQTRIGYYEVLMEAINRTKQTGLAALLKM